MQENNFLGYIKTKFNILTYKKQRFRVSRTKFKNYIKI